MNKTNSFWELILIFKKNAIEYEYVVEVKGMSIHSLTD
jgi:hypothetical protein